MEHKGFILIEITITIVILSIIVLPIGALFSKSSLTNKKGKEIIIGTTLAQEKIEEIKAGSFHELGNIKESQEQIMSNGLLFQRRSKVSSEDSNLYIVSVEVFWDGGEVKLVTYRGNH